ncbi:MAG: flavodoxin family protein [Sphaerochaetaceae bacterium]|nr:flavodoxin family protein [Sphaerochaetaceae bacterium]
MKVLAINGSSRRNGNTKYGLNLMKEVLEKEGIDVEIYNIGTTPFHQCIDCQRCFREKDGKCVFDDDPVNELFLKFKECDGVIFGSPVHFSGMAGGFKAILDRLFYVNIANGNVLRHKVGCSFGAVRRAGAIEAMDQMNKYLQYAEMIVPTSDYWNVIYGMAKGEAAKDVEGNRILKNLAQNMAWSLKLVENGKNSVAEPDEIKSEFTNMIR